MPDKSCDKSNVNNDFYVIETNHLDEKNTEINTVNTVKWLKSWFSIIIFVCFGRLQNSSSWRKLLRFIDLWCKNLSSKKTAKRLDNYNYNHVQRLVYLEV